MTPAALASSLEQNALVALGHCVHEGKTLVLIGPDEPSFWPHFTASPEYRDGAPDPLDRWSLRVLDGIAADIGATPVYPFGGPPFHPFHTWAVRSGRFWASPIGFLVHDTAGLFASFRGALILEAAWPAVTGSNPCLTCPDRPCATACPVGAFGDGYDVAACKTHVASPEGVVCLTDGCRARRACPVGQDRRLSEQAAFHMKAFL